MQNDHRLGSDAAIIDFTEIPRTDAQGPIMADTSIPQEKLQAFVKVCEFGVLDATCNPQHNNSTRKVCFNNTNTQLYYIGDIGKKKAYSGILKLGWIFDKPQ